MKKEEIKNIHKLTRKVIYDIEQIVKKSDLEVEKKKKAKQFDIKYYIAKEIGSYVCIYGKISYTQHIDLLMLNCRRIFEVLVLLRMLNTSKKYSDIFNYELNDREEILTAFIRLKENNIIKYPEREKLEKADIKRIEDIKRGILKKHAAYNIVPVGMKQLGDVIKTEINDSYLRNEHRSIYKIISKTLHCSPFLLFPQFSNINEMLRDTFFIQIGLYLEEIKKELEKILSEEVNVQQSGQAS